MLQILIVLGLLLMVGGAVAMYFEKKGRKG